MDISYAIHNDCNEKNKHLDRSFEREEDRGRKREINKKRGETG